MNIRAAVDGDFITIDTPTGGIQRLVARFHAHAYDPHRHETYAIGMTLSGAQAFRYRGAGRVSHVGESMILHPDELHDGHSDVPEGFVYRMVYVEPMLIAAAGGARPLPFVADAVSQDAALTDLLREFYETFPSPTGSLERDAFIERLAAILDRRGGHVASPGRLLPASTRLRRVAEHLRECYAEPIESADIERIAGLDRFEIARQFRRLSGTSPHRYLVGRRLDAARAHILAGDPLADVASRTGFADQSHMTRHFKARFGMTPGRYASLATPERDRRR